MRTIGGWISGIALLTFMAIPMSNAQSNEGSPNSSRSFAKRENVQIKINNQTWLEDTKEQDNNWENNPTFPIKLAPGPNEPLICRHSDLSRDVEFRMCRNQLLGTLESYMREEDPLKKSEE
jgi:hypothetical protein